jgi:hypothetical protein
METYYGIDAMRTELPIDASIDTIVDRVRASRAVVVTAAPGAGKTTRVPPALVDDGPVLLLQAAPCRRARHCTAHCRRARVDAWTRSRVARASDRNFSSETRLLVATEGILTARLQQDPVAADVRTIVHRRVPRTKSSSPRSDLALARQAWLARDDSATRRDVGDARCRSRPRPISRTAPSSTYRVRESFPLEVSYPPRSRHGSRDRGCAAGVGRFVVLFSWRAGDPPHG